MTAARSSPRVAIILAAGKGTRMRSARSKVLHSAGGRPLLRWVIDAARDAGCETIVVIVGHQAEDVRAAFAGEADLVWVEQKEQRGTGHALLQAEHAVPWEATLLVLSGDVPLLRPETLVSLAIDASEAWGAMAVAELPEPGGLGRVIGASTLERIVEHADASPTERAIRRVNAGIYALPAAEIFGYLHALRPDNAKGELYLTDALGAAARGGKTVRLLDLADVSEAWGVNDRRDLAAVHLRLLGRHAEQLMADGVTLLDPAQTAIESTVRVGADTIIHSGVTLLGSTTVGERVVLHHGAWVRDSVLADDTVVHPYSVLDGASLAPGAEVGPFARLRPGAVLEERAKVGNFVEVKKSRLGRGAKAGHLAYLGDADVGAHANNGAGVITCNYDGEAKHRTEIGEGAFVGSDTMLVAPVRVGDGATTAAGSTITQDVPPGALGVGRARQRTIEGWAERRSRRPAKPARESEEPAPPAPGSTRE